MDAIDQLRPVTYTLAHDGKRYMGFVAQELREVCPHLVTIRQNGAVPDFHYVDSMALLAYVVHCVKALKQFVLKNYRKHDVDR